MRRMRTSRAILEVPLPTFQSALGASSIPARRQPVVALYNLMDQPNDVKCSDQFARK